MLGERISCGKGDCRRVGRRSWSMRRAFAVAMVSVRLLGEHTPYLLGIIWYDLLFPSLTLRSLSGFDELLLLLGVSGIGGLNRGIVELNHIRVNSDCCCRVTGVELRGPVIRTGGGLEAAGGEKGVALLLDIEGTTATRARAAAGAAWLRAWVDARATLTLLLRDMNLRPPR